MSVAAISVRNLDDRVMELIRVRAARHGVPWRPKSARSLSTRLRSRTKAPTWLRLLWPALVSSAELSSTCRREAPHRDQSSLPMIILDTNVVSELMRPEPDARVRQWVNGLRADELGTTAVTVAEIRYGIERLPDGRRKEGPAVRRGGPLLRVR